MNIIKEYKNFNNVKEDKIFKFSEYEPTKYNGNILVTQIMEWLRAKLLDEPGSDSITVPLQQFYNECSVDKNKFLTLYNEQEKTHSLNNFDIEINDENITFKNFKNETVEENNKI